MLGTSRARANSAHSSKRGQTVSSNGSNNSRRMSIGVDQHMGIETNSAQGDAPVMYEESPDKRGRQSNDSWEKFAANIKKESKL